MAFALDTLVWRTVVPLMNFYPICRIIGAGDTTELKVQLQAPVQCSSGPVVSMGSVSYSWELTSAVCDPSSTGSDCTVPTWSPTVASNFVHPTDPRQLVIPAFTLAVGIKCEKPHALTLAATALWSPLP